MLAIGRCDVFVLVATSYRIWDICVVMVAVANGTCSVMVVKT